MLARACLEHDEQLDRAATLIGRAVNGYLGGDLRLRGDYTGQLTQMMLPIAYRTAAEIALARDDWGAALGCARAVQVVETRTHPGGYELEARLWEEVGQDQRAELAWARALNAGSKTGRARLQQLFERAGGDVDGFDDHLAALLAKADDHARPLAPEFSVRDLDDRALDLAKLGGRVVVLNFWGLGCAPCKVEIPHLSELADSYRDKPVDFIAFATDGADALRAYLADHPFTYRIVASAGHVASRYKVQAWPTHVIIDKQGRITATLVGGGVDQDERLRPLIERALRE